MYLCMSCRWKQHQQQWQQQRRRTNCCVEFFIYKITQWAIQQRSKQQQQQEHWRRAEWNKAYRYQIACTCNERQGDIFTSSFILYPHNWAVRCFFIAAVAYSFYFSFFSVKKILYFHFFLSSFRSIVGWLACLTRSFPIEAVKILLQKFPQPSVINYNR